jgi:hypothetical protein
MNKSVYIFALLSTFILFLNSCGQTKKIIKGNYVFQYADRQKQRITLADSIKDRFYVYQIENTTKSKIEEKTDYLIIKNTSEIINNSNRVDSIFIKPPKADKIFINGSIYSTENSKEIPDKYKKPFKYNDIRFAIQTLSIPLKFRNSLDDGTKYPAQVETGINIGFAPVMKYNLNIYNSINKMMGKPLNQYSINCGLILNIGATDLKTASNAPGLISDRKSPMFTYGTFLMFGVNNINFGYAIGWDKIIGEGHANWVYQNKTWHGLIIALDIIKP